jgi:hypothetical protein
MWRHFTDKEVEGLDRNLVAHLDQARESAGVPFILTETVASGGSHAENSSHARGMGVDIRAHGSRARFRIVYGLIVAGFHRIGIYSRHIHADMDHTLDWDVMWLGESK